MKWNVAIVAAAILAYLPALNNGFIADDWVILQRIEILKTDPMFLFDIVPENFRLTSYVVFGALKAAFGYDARPYYIFNILLHAANCLLLREVVLGISSDAALAGFTGLLFAVFQAPQEAVMWLAAMNETLLGFFAFLAILFWIRGRYALAAAAVFAALFSKESGVVLLALLPFLDLLRGRRAPTRAYLALGAPAVTAVSLLLWTWSSNFQVGNGTYSLNAHAGFVLLKSLHRLIWPWGYIVALLMLALRLHAAAWKKAAWASIVVLTMLPYIFVTYTDNIPSRQVYLASAAFLPLLAAAMTRVHRVALGAAFIIFNIVFMWNTKDRQMEERAAPTAALVESFRAMPPDSVVISSFPYAPLTIIARAVAVSVPGWENQSVELGESCDRCTLLHWNSASRRYEATRR